MSKPYIPKKQRILQVILAELFSHPSSTLEKHQCFDIANAIYNRLESLDFEILQKKLAEEPDSEYSPELKQQIANMAKE